MSSPSKTPSKLIAGPGWVGLACPLDRVLTYKNLIYLLKLQFYCANTSYPQKVQELQHLNSSKEHFKHTEHLLSFKQTE